MWWRPSRLWFHRDPVARRTRTVLDALRVVRNHVAPCADLVERASEPALRASAPKERTATGTRIHQARRRFHQDGAGLERDRDVLTGGLRRGARGAPGQGTAAPVPGNRSAP